MRKTFGKYELAVIQTTHVDRERLLVHLTTTIAHSSGEWISALYPVCHLSDIGHPKLMGALLTYARRYCLFTMVGLAGEDDLDAPDFLTTNAREIAGNGPNPETPLGGKPDIDLERSSSTSFAKDGVGNDAETSFAQDVEPPRRKRRVARRAPLSSSSFARSRDPRSDLANIADADALFRWALEILPARNKLDDAQRAAFDAAFLARADAIGADPELLIPFTHRAPSPPGDGPCCRGHEKASDEAQAPVQKLQTTLAASPAASANHAAAKGTLLRLRDADDAGQNCLRSSSAAGFTRRMRECE